MRLALEKGRDRLLELNSNGGEKAQRLASEIAQTDNSLQLVDFALNLFDIIGVEQDDLGENSIVITPTGTMLVPDFPGLKEEGEMCIRDRIEAVRKALLASKIISYAQGFMLIREASEQFGWNINYGATALLWREGCIIRSRFLGNIRDAYEEMCIRDRFSFFQAC